MKKLGTDPYKGTRDFYPEEMAVQRYIFDTWAHVAESFGFERYDASVLEPAELYRSKSNEEIVNEQTYTFTDRGDREVTLRPEMTPTVARMIAGRRRELAFPARWYSIPNLFRYERPQRGRVREHWQLNCDIFGADHYAADVEIIALAYQVLIAFGATPDMFEIRINHRQLMRDWFEKEFNITEPERVVALTRELDRMKKITKEEFKKNVEPIIAGDFDKFREALDMDLRSFMEVMHAVEQDSVLLEVQKGLHALGIENVVFDASLARGFDYYTGTIFEIFDTSGENPRSLLGGGRYDNLTELFGGEPIAGVGFGMGDVTMRDFLETHGLLTAGITAPTVMILPTDLSLAVPAEALAAQLRAHDVSVAVDFGDRKLGKKIAAAGDALVEYILVFGDDEATSNTFTLKNLTDGTEHSGTLEELLSVLS